MITFSCFLIASMCLPRAFSITCHNFEMDYTRDKRDPRECETPSADACGISACKRKDGSKVLVGGCFNKAENPKDNYRGCKAYPLGYEETNLRGCVVCICDDRDNCNDAGFEDTAWVKVPEEGEKAIYYDQNGVRVGSGSQVREVGAIVIVLGVCVCFCVIF